MKTTSQKTPKKVIILAGLSGAGKTTRRTTDPRLKDLPYVDVADLHRDLSTIGYEPSTDRVHSAALNKVFEYLDHTDTVVLEGWYLPGTPTLKKVCNQLRGWDIQIEYIYLKADINTCIQRVKEQWKREGNEKNRRFFEKRLELLEIKRQATA